MYENFERSISDFPFSSVLSDPSVRDRAIFTHFTYRISHQPNLIFLENKATAGRTSRLIIDSPWNPFIRNAVSRCRFLPLAISIHALLYSIESTSFPLFLRLFYFKFHSRLIATRICMYVCYVRQPSSSGYFHRRDRQTRLTGSWSPSKDTVIRSAIRGNPSLLGSRRVETFSHALKQRSSITKFVGWKRSSVTDPAVIRTILRTSTLEFVAQRGYPMHRIFFATTDVDVVHLHRHCSFYTLCRYFSSSRITRRSSFSTSTRAKRTRPCKTSCSLFLIFLSGRPTNQRFVGTRKRDAYTRGENKPPKWKSQFSTQSGTKLLRHQSIGGCISSAIFRIFTINNYYNMCLY